jgi:hypothetical protein
VLVSTFAELVEPTTIPARASAVTNSATAVARKPIAAAGVSGC